MSGNRSLGLVVVGMVGAAFVLAGCSSAGGPQEPPTIEGGLSLSPASDVVYECLTEKGWNVSLSWDGGIESSSETVPEAQRDSFMADSEACWAPINDRIANLKPQDISEVYRSELATRDCLIERGHDVETPPSEQQYIDTFHSTRWSAYAASSLNPGMADEDWRAINEACPQPAWSLGL